MLLTEFFGNIDQSDKPQTDTEDQKFFDDVFWSIIDDDDLYKEYFLKTAREIKSHNGMKHEWKAWMPMVNAGCMKFYKSHDIHKHPSDAFPKEMKKELANRVATHYHDGIINDDYDVGM